MFLELLAYEVVTGVAPFIGLKMVADKRYLKGINQRKSTPLDGYLKRKVGRMSKTERSVSAHAVHTIGYITKFKALDYLLVLAARHVQANAMRGTPWQIGKGSV